MDVPFKQLPDHHNFNQTTHLLFPLGNLTINSIIKCSSFDAREFPLESYEFLWTFNASFEKILIFRDGDLSHSLETVMCTNSLRKVGEKTQPCPQLKQCEIIPWHLMSPPENTNS
jgi:hypothetical protein